MPPKSKKSVLLMVANVGITSLEQNSLEEEPFLDKAKYAMRILVEKKIFLQPKDEIGIITMGDTSDNPEDINFVKLYSEHLSIPNWEMVKYIQNLLPTVNPCNWIEALHVAFRFMKREVFNPDITVFLVIFNNFKEHSDCVNKYDSEPIINDLKQFDCLRILFVGEKSLDEQSQEQNLSASEEFALSIIQEVQAQYEQINDFIETRRFYMAPPASPTAWKCDLEWAGLNIPCASFVKVCESSKLGSWHMRASDSSQNLLNNSSNLLDGSTSRVVKERLNIDIHRNEIEPEKIIYGYKFGGRYIPLSDEEEKAMSYSGSTKGMVVCGFVPQNEVKLEYWTGNGSRIIVPTSEETATAFYSFVQAMVEKQYAAIIQKVYQQNLVPKYGILFPKVDEDNIWCLVHLELPFTNDLRAIQKRPIKSIDKIVSEERLEALDKFIDSMTVKRNEAEYLNPGCFPNISTQYQWNALADRALNPKNPLLPMNDYFRKYLEPPSDLKIKASPCLEELNKLFESCGMIKIEKKRKKKEQSSNVLSEEKEKDNTNNEITENKELNFNVKNGPDEEIFSQEDVDIKMEELDSM